MNIKALREEGAKLVADIRKMADLIEAENRDFTAEENERWAKLNKDYNAILARVQILQRAEDLGRDQESRAGDRAVGRGDFDGRRATGADREGSVEESRTLAMQAWFRCQLRQPLGEEHVEACQAVGFRPDSPELVLALYGSQDLRELQSRFRSVHPARAKDHVADFRATLSSQNPTSGAYLVPPATMIRNLEINMLAFGGMRQVAETITTTTGEPMLWPTADDTSNTGAQLGESTTIGSSVDPSFTQVRWDAYKFSSKPILVPYELLEDSAFNLPGVLGDMLGERLGRVTNTKYTTGTGAATPKGLVTAASSFSAASATAIAADDLFGLVHSIDPAYRMGAGFMMHDSIVLYLRKLKDGEGGYLWQSGLQTNTPDRLQGYAITINQDMDSTVASGKKTILFGQLGKYKIRRVNGLRLYRLQERYRDTDQDAFLAFIREDGNLLTAGTAPVKYLSH